MPQSRGTDLRQRFKAQALATAVGMVALVAGLVWMNLSDEGPAIVREYDTYPAGGPRPPERGAWFGAYVEPRGGDHTQQGQIDAVTDFDRRIGGPLDIVRTYYPWGKPFPRDVDRRFASEGRVLMIGWGGTRTDAIVDGREDKVIRARARDVRKLGKPILLAWRGEMDRPNLQKEIGSPERYIAAWRRIRGIFDSERVTNVGWAWCPTVEGFDAGRAPAYYPGDGQVDWICADGYAYPKLRPPEQIFGSFLTWAQGHGKPVVIGEYGAEENGGARAEWLRTFGDYIRRQPQVKALAYYDKNHPHNKKTTMYYSLRGHPASMRAFRELAQSSYFNPDGWRRP
ncbi:MAG: hypothetical protein ACRDNL_12710 [Spirillospora sp.]